jgi:hypothetical protein
MAKVPDGPLPEMTKVEFGDHVNATVRLKRSELENDHAAPLWLMIVKHTESLGFDRYAAFIDQVLSTNWNNQAKTKELYDFSKSAHIGLDPYLLLRIATEAFLLANAGVWRETSLGNKSALATMLDERGYLAKKYGLTDEGDDNPITAGRDDTVDGDGRGVIQPGDTYGRANDAHSVRGRLERLLGDTRNSYIDAIYPSLSACCGEPREYSPSPFSCLGGDPTLPVLLELIWSYWHEEGMLSQTMNTVACRFQNIRRGNGHDPLGELELAPLRPLSTLLWGFVNDEPNRLSVRRRAYEYQHQYGLSLDGKATAGMTPADTRNRFIEAFHALLRACVIFYAQEDQTTVVADGFPVLNALKEVHMLLAEGAHNQFRDLPWTARVEMLIEQWFLARPEMRDFLRGRWMVPYPEQWMGGVDAMKRLQSWSDVSVLHFHDLGVYGERLILSIRHYGWMKTNDHEVARTWARFFRPEVQSYIHAYRAATGADIAAFDHADATMPSNLLRRRLAEQAAGSGGIAGAARLRGGDAAGRRALTGGEAIAPAALPPVRSNVSR